MPALDRDLLIIGAGLIGTSVGLAATAAGWSVRLAEPALVGTAGAALDIVPLLDQLIGLGLVSVRGSGEARFRQIGRAHV